MRFPPLQKNNTISLEQFLRLQEIKPANEYIEGHIFQKPMPQFRHSTFQSEIIFCLNQIGKPKKIAYAFPELRCNFAGTLIVPDIAVKLWQNILFQANR
jgi:Uma2 family endonuclease